jgi:hypothetical protein
VHHVAFRELQLDLNDIPTHFFTVARRLRDSVSSAGWHVAHIYDAKDGNTDWRMWRRPELVSRFVRNLHPCNCFYVPKLGWQRFGGDKRVIAAVAAKYAARYESIWPEFLELVSGAPLPQVDMCTVRYATDDFRATRPRSTAGDAASYSFSRLGFKKSVIEPLKDGDSFQVVPPHGTCRGT